MNREECEEIVERLDRYTDVPDDVLATVVRRDGLCFWAFDREGMPDLSGEAEPDRELAAWLCAGCPVMDECLEWELRSAGDDTVGVWGGLSEIDRRAVARVWKWRHINRRPRGGESP